MEIKVFKKITRYDDYTINEFVRDLVETRKSLETKENTVDENEKELETLKTVINNEEHDLSEEELNKKQEEIIKKQDEISAYKEELESIKTTLEKMEEEKDRIKAKLQEKIAESEKKIDINKEEISKNEEKIKENEEEMKAIDPNSDEYGELENENKLLQKKISYKNGSITRYGKKINHLKEVEGNLDKENVLEGLIPPRTIKSKARTLSGKRVKKKEELVVNKEEKDNVDVRTEAKEESNIESIVRNSETATETSRSISTFGTTIKNEEIPESRPRKISTLEKVETDGKIPNPENKVEVKEEISAIKESEELKRNSLLKRLIDGVKRIINSIKLKISGDDKKLLGEAPKEVQVKNENKTLIESDREKFRKSLLYQGYLKGKNAALKDYSTPGSIRTPEQSENFKKMEDYAKEFKERLKVEQKSEPIIEPKVETNEKVEELTK